MRQGVAVLVLVLGLDLMVVGSVAWGLAASVPPPPPETPAVAPANDAPKSKKTPKPKPPRHPKPPPPNPALERWHKARQQQRIGLVVAGCGLLIALLGSVRVGFAVAERRQFASPVQTNTNGCAPESGDRSA